nr:MFS transporter [uncultured Moellerella sp.]
MSLSLYYRIVLIGILVQFVNVFDFMVIVPISPILVEELTIPAANIGFITGSYTLAAALASLVCARFLDKFNRKLVLQILLFGLISGSLLTAFSYDQFTLILFRIITGAFAGPLIGITLAIIIDQIDPQRRGRAIAAVMGTFTVVAVLAIPLSLQLVQYVSWRSLFMIISAFGLVSFLLTMKFLPSMPVDLPNQKTLEQPSFWQQKKVIYSMLLMAGAVFSTFLIIPNLAIYLMKNRHLPFEELSSFYFWGGIISFIAMQAVGYLNKAQQPKYILLVTTLVIIYLLFDQFIFNKQIPLLAFFVLLMSLTASRTVTIIIANSHIPSTTNRAAYSSIQSAIQHFASGCAGAISSLILSEQNEQLIGLNKVAGLAIIISIILPLLYSRIFNSKLILAK